MKLLLALILLALSGICSAAIELTHTSDNRYELIITQDIIFDFSSEPTPPCPNSGAALIVSNAFLGTSIPTMASIPTSIFPTLKMKVCAKSDTGDFVTYEYQSASFRVLDHLPANAQGYLNGGFSFDSPNTALPDNLSHSIDRFIIRAGTYLSNFSPLPPDTTDYIAGDLRFDWLDADCIDGMVLPEGFSKTGADLTSSIVPMITISRAVVLDFPTESCSQYQVEGSIDGNTWFPFGSPIAGDGETHEAFFRAENSVQLFRVRVTP